MRLGWVRGTVAGFFLVYLLAVTWPVGTAFARPEPFVLGLPFSFFWPALWIVLGGAVLILLDRAEEKRMRASERNAGAREIDPGGGGAAR
jgi:hypothetical protein